MAKKRKPGSNEQLSAKFLKLEPNPLLLPPPEDWESDSDEPSDEREEEAEEEEDDGDELEDSSSGEEEDEEGEGEEEEGEGEDEEEGEDEDEEEEDKDEDEDEDSKRNTIKKFLQPLGKDQLIKILKEASDANSSIVADIVKNAKSDPIQRNIFVYGLGPECSNEMLKSVFKLYGTIKECNVVADKYTGKCKGYAFILYKKRDSAMKALKQPQKKVGSRMVSCQLAAIGSDNPQSTHDNKTRKLYIGNVGPHISPEKLRAHFALYGEIEEGPIGIDKLTGKFKGYALIVYKTDMGIKKALEEPVKLLDGCRLHCSVAMGKASAANPVIGSTPSPNVPIPGAVGPTVPPVNAVFPNFPVGLNPGTVLMSRNAGIGMVNPVLGIGTSTTQNPVGLSATFASGASQPPSRIGNPPPVGLGTGITLQPGMNSTSPSVMSNYGSQAAFHGFGAYQNPQLIQSSASTAFRYTTAGAGSVAAPPSYFGYRG